MTGIQQEKLESINELFLLTIGGLETSLKANELTDQDIDNMIEALQIIRRQYMTLKES